MIWVLSSKASFDGLKISSFKVALEKSAVAFLSLDRFRILISTAAWIFFGDCPGWTLSRCCADCLTHAFERGVGVVGPRGKGAKGSPRTVKEWFFEKSSESRLKYEHF